MASGDPYLDESAVAADVAQRLGTNHTTLRVTGEDALDLVPRLPEVYDEPFADASQIPTLLISRLAREHVKVCLTGDGGDEIFYGYNRHVKLAQIWNRVSSVPLSTRKRVGRILERASARTYAWALCGNVTGVRADHVRKLGLVLQSDDLESAYVALATFWPDPVPVLTANARDAISHASPWRAPLPMLPELLDRLLWLETTTSLPDDMLVKVDRAAMSVGLETRVPLLDARVVEFAWSLDTSLKIRGGKGKWILRELRKKYIPESIGSARKQGFSIPLDQWLRGPLKDWAEALLDPAKIDQEGFLDSRQIAATWKSHIVSDANHHGRLWAVLMFESWLDANRRSNIRDYE